MIVPQFWAEARLQQPRRKGVSQVTVRRFGWSDDSQAAAEQMAGQRTQDALKRIASGESLLRRSEPKVPYNGAEGIPIREEVLSRQEDVVITRNAYGAHCLNTPDVLFADIDFQNEPRARWILLHFMQLLAAGILVSLWLRSGVAVIVSIIAVLVLGYPFAALTHKVLLSLRGGPERQARTRLAAVVRRHPDWHLRLYRTPAGFRVLVMHRTFDPIDPEVDEFFKALGVDPVYAAMCKNQKCFRARVSPKPWRIGISAHMRPRPGVWPVNPEYLETRQTWVRAYEVAASVYASCKFLESHGSNTVVPKTTFIRVLHDDLSQALSDREIA